MIVTPLKIPEVKVLEPQIFNDERGYFYESYNKDKFNLEIGENITFVQDNQSLSSKGVLRGLHYQKEPYSQSKLIRVISGEVFDVAVDIRKNSKTYGHWVGEFLSGKNKKQLWIPKGFAHGFLSLTENTILQYKVDEFYNKNYEEILKWDDPTIGIIWPKIDAGFVISPKDLNPNLK